MTVMLVVVTFGALALSGVLAYYVLRVTRQERERSDARAAALAEALGTTPAFDFQPMHVGSAEPHAITVVGAAPMFGAGVDGDQAPSRRWMIPAIGALVVGVVLAGIYSWNRTAPPAEAATSAQPLELLALTHERQGDSLVVSGLIRNPVAGRPVAGLTAVAFTFNRQGTFLTSGRAEVDYPRLGAGDESPFSVKLPQTAGVTRYRVSFRTESGVLSHVDRRERSVAVMPAGTEVRR
jgi:hypothetical protein